jgi:hypothetical protein
MWNLYAFPDLQVLELGDYAVCVMDIAPNQILQELVAVEPTPSLPHLARLGRKKGVRKAKAIKAAPSIPSPIFLSFNLPLSFLENLRNDYCT